MYHSSEKQDERPAEGVPTAQPHKRTAGPPGTRTSGLHPSRFVTTWQHAAANQRGRAPDSDEPSSVPGTGQPSKKTQPYTAVVHERLLGEDTGTHQEGNGTRSPLAELQVALGRSGEWAGSCGRAGLRRDGPPRASTGAQRARHRRAWGLSAWRLQKLLPPGMTEGRKRWAQRGVGVL